MDMTKAKLTNKAYDLMPLLTLWFYSNIRGSEGGYTTDSIIKANDAWRKMMEANHAPVRWGEMGREEAQELIEEMLRLGLLRVGNKGAVLLSKKMADQILNIREAAKAVLGNRVEYPYACIAGLVKTRNISSREIGLGVGKLSGGEYVEDIKVRKRDLAWAIQRKIQALQTNREMEIEKEGDKWGVIADELVYVWQTEKGKRKGEWKACIDGEALSDPRWMEKVAKQIL